MTLDLRTRIAYLIHFSDSISEGYFYGDSSYVTEKNGKIMPLWDKIVKDFYRISDGYFQVADMILEEVRSDERNKV